MMSHPSSETIARLVENSLSDEERENVLRHMATCEACYSEYELVIRGHAIPDAPPARVRLRSIRLAATGLAAAAAIALLTMWALRDGASPPYSPPSAILAAVQHASTNGPVFPGGIAADGGTVYRSGSTTSSSALVGTVDSLASLCSGDDVACATWVAAGYIVAGRLDAADLTLRRLSMSARNTPDALVVRGILHHRRNELDEARARFEAAVAANRRHAEARFNLGLVLAELGDRDRAVDELRWVIDHGPPRLAERAQRELRS